MTARWFFRIKPPRDTVREPIQGEFFSNEAIDNSTEALVREAIQNSLDNRSRSADKVVLRFVLCGGSAARSSREMSTLTDGLFEHLAAPGNGLLHAVTVETRCPFLLIEDFGTTGLTGNPEAWDSEGESRNNFYAFFRAEGQSDKSGVSLGRWGVGKFVFPRSSRASSFFALTVPEGTASPLLMGRAILRSHRVRDTTFLPDGYWGVGHDDTKPVLLSDLPLIENSGNVRNPAHDRARLRSWFRGSTKTRRASRIEAACIGTTSFRSSRSAKSRSNRMTGRSI